MLRRGSRSGWSRVGEIKKVGRSKARVVVVAMFMVRYGLDDTHTCDCEALRIYKVLEKGEKATLSRSLADHAIGFGTEGSFVPVYLGSLY